MDRYDDRDNIDENRGGLKGVTLKPEVVKKWAFSLNTFGLIDREVEEYDCAQKPIGLEDFSSRS